MTLGTNIGVIPRRMREYSYRVYQFPGGSDHTHSGFPPWVNFPEDKPFSLCIVQPPGG